MVKGRRLEISLFVNGELSAVNINGDYIGVILR